jgi:hypothetical protein
MSFASKVGRRWCCQPSNVTAFMALGATTTLRRRPKMKVIAFCNAHWERRSADVGCADPGLLFDAD